MNELIVPILTIAGITVVSILAMSLVRKVIDHNYLIKHHEVSNPMMSVVGTLYSVLLGFLIAGALNAYSLASDRVNQEAQYLANIFRLAKGLPIEERKVIRNTCREYCDAVYHEEWPLLNKGEDSKYAWTMYYRLWDEALSVQPTDNRQNNIQQAMFPAIQGLGDCRRSRMALINRKFPPLLSLVVIVGSLIIIGFTYLFIAEGIILQSVLTGLVTISLGLNVYLLYDLSHPFKGNLQIQPLGFKLDEDLFKQADDPPEFFRTFGQEKMDGK